MPKAYRDILVVDLLGGLGDLVMVLPVVHALARRNPGAALRVLTHQPGAELLRSDPTVTEVVWPDGQADGAERAAVARELARRRPDLVVSTTRYDGIPELIERSGARRVTDLWRRPPPDEPVGWRYLRILRDEGLVDGTPEQARIHLTEPELRRGDRVIAEHLPIGAPPPVVLVPSAGMAVKFWPRWPALATALRRRGTPVLVVTEHPAAGPDGARRLPPTDLRGVAAYFAAAGRRGGAVIGSDTGPVRVATAVGARAVGLFGPTLAARYGIDPQAAVNLQGLPGCRHRRPTSITEQICWWSAECPLSARGPACMSDISVDAVLAALDSLPRL